MEIIRVFFQPFPDTAVEVQSFAVTDWYAKPKVLHSLAYKFTQLLESSSLFLICSKYGCKQFTPYLYENFRVRNINFSDFRPDLPWCVIEFSDKLDTK